MAFENKARLVVHKVNAKATNFCPRSVLEPRGQRHFSTTLFLLINWLILQINARLKYLKNKLILLA